MFSKNRQHFRGLRFRGLHFRGLCFRGLCFGGLRFRGLRSVVCVFEVCVFETFLSRVLGVMFSNKCSVFFLLAFGAQFLPFLVAYLLDFQ